jgi:hypothetical protein
MSKSNFAKLKNTELVFISFIMKDVLKTYQQVIENQGVSNRLALPDNSYIESFKSLTEEEVKEIEDSIRFKYIKEINKKLDEVTGLIKDSFPKLYNDVEELFQTSIDPNDNDFSV